MNKSIKTFLDGYIFFKVKTNDNIKYYLSYNSAKKAVPEVGYCEFAGFHAFYMIWKMMYYRSNSNIEWYRMERYEEKLNGMEF